MKLPTGRELHNIREEVGYFITLECCASCMHGIAGTTQWICNRPACIKPPLQRFPVSPVGKCDLWKKGPTIES